MVPEAAGRDQARDDAFEGRGWERREDRERAQEGEPALRDSDGSVDLDETPPG